MSEFFKVLGTNLTERLIVAAFAAIITTFVLTQRHEERILSTEKLVAAQQVELAHAIDDQHTRCAEVQERLARLEALLEVHSKQ